MSPCHEHALVMRPVTVETGSASGRSAIRGYVNGLNHRRITMSQNSSNITPSKFWIFFDAYSFAPTSYQISSETTDGGGAEIVCKLDMHTPRSDLDGTETGSSRLELPFKYQADGGLEVPSICLPRRVPGADVKCSETFTLGRPVFTLLEKGYVIRRRNVRNLYVWPSHGHG
ncbi:hypothetical protein BV25DRAFT_1221554 [Artomyces pyxidatus]|uniref:Uncharacterized protein n=1 Tax=Artomyces pyxidatus TaxID=48021 RepID=A0ACB8SQZ7_9AGAM|nr:hypothetical protein BV25DRAFT_1221554 [Artomyces pyxidatus]